MYWFVSRSAGSRLRGGNQFRYAFGNSRQHIMLDGIECALDGPFITIGIFPAVALEDQTSQTEQAGAVVAGRIHTLRNRLERTARNQSAKQIERTALEFCRKHGFDETTEPFRRLKSHIAEEADATDDVSRAYEDVVAYDIAVKVKQAFCMVGAQQSRRLLDHFVALDVLFADIEQVNSGLRFAFDCRYQRRTHLRELI